MFPHHLTERSFELTWMHSVNLNPANVGAFLFHYVSVELRYKEFPSKISCQCTYFPLSLLCSHKIPLGEPVCHSMVIHLALA